MHTVTVCTRRASDQSILEHVGLIGSFSLWQSQGKAEDGNWSVRPSRRADPKKPAGFPAGLGSPIVLAKYTGLEGAASVSWVSFLCPDANKVFFQLSSTQII